MPNQLVWFKRDLRTTDHAPLTLAAQRGIVWGLYVIEPEWLSSEEFDSSHFVFLIESLKELRARLATLGVPLIVRYGEATQALDSVYRSLGFSSLHSHEETGLLWTFARDKRVKIWARANGVEWIETPQFGVIRGLKDRDQWEGERTRIVNRPLLPEISQVQPSSQAVAIGDIPELADLRLPPSGKVLAQRGGRTEAVRTLESFIFKRGVSYFGSLSSPNSAFEGCSRLSPYLAWGHLSVSEVLQCLNQRRAALEGEAKADAWRRSLDQFESRMWWHCHFIQKLESEPTLELQNMNRAFDGMRETEFDESKFRAWCAGETGFPLIDAAMRALHKYGWINFRMRAMLMSFASYQLWLHWQKPAQYLARQFVDFEPGIHYSQAQMQSGVTGINTIRIYSPQKQMIEKDPEARFIRAHCPELAHLSPSDIRDLSAMPPLLAQAQGFRLGRDYPHPIVDPTESYNHARDRIFTWLKSPNVQRTAKNVFEKHGSRKRR